MIYRLMLLILLFCFTAGKTQSQTPERPNVILIMCDDLGWGDVGFNGNEKIETPNLDRLAGKGAVLNRFYSAGPVCSPTRGSCITGRNPFRLGIPTANSGYLKPEEITLPELLKAQGYTTGHFGKWHLGTLTTSIKDANRGKPRDYSHYSTPAMNGYDEYFATESKVPTYDPMVYPTQFDTALGESKRYGWAAVEGANAGKKLETYGTFYWQGKEQLVLENTDGDDSRVIMDRVIPFVRKAASAQMPFFTTIWFHTPHLPLVAPEKYRAKYSQLTHKEQLLYGSITMMDEQVGRLWEQLEAMGVADNTMLWFCSDNGPEAGTPGSAGPFRARKRSLYEGGVRVPAFVVWPARISSGWQLNTPAVTSDYLPTIADYLGIESPKRPIDGISLKRVLEQKGGDREQPIGFLAPGKMSWVTDRYKLISNDKGKTFELYDLISDQGESSDIAAKHKKTVDRYKADLLEWVESCDQSRNGADY